MRIAIVNRNRHRAGGVESYLAELIPALARRGHALAFFHEVEPPADREPIELPDGSPRWSVAALGPEAALAALARWRPEAIYAHGLESPEVEARTLDVAPAAFFAHSYYGTCVSGAKAFRYPVARPCDRRFGPGCLGRYFPLGCGGRNPVTMAREYGRQAARQRLLERYGRILVASSHMVAEYRNHGFQDLLSLVPLPASNSEPGPRAYVEHRVRSCWRLAFLGRMEAVKGGTSLLDALPSAAAKLDRRLRLTMAGDGPARGAWQNQAARLLDEHAGIEVDFPGWLDADGTRALLRECDLLVMPSVWPEPYGLSGLEAGLFSVPAAAFDVGGISDWLKEGVNGALAGGDPPTAASLSGAIVRCLADPIRHERLRRGARAEAERFSMEAHLAALEPLLAQLAEPAPAARAERSACGRREGGAPRLSKEAAEHVRRA